MAAQPSDEVPYEALTPYGRKRRSLRRHREDLRVAVTVLQNHGLWEEFDDLCIEVNGNNSVWLGRMVKAGEADEPDDPLTDPMLAVQRDTAVERESLARLIEALEVRHRDEERLEALQLDLERARMFAEDLTSRLA